MSRFSYTYQPLLQFKLEHPNNVDISSHVKFVPSAETIIQLNDQKLIFKSTESGFILSQKISQVYEESKDINNQIVYSPKETITWLDVSNGIINLEFICNANLAFIKNTNWQNQGPKPIIPNQPLVNFTYKEYVASYDSPNATPDINSSSTEVEYRLDQGDFEYEPVAKFKFVLAGHIPSLTHKTQTLIL